MKTAGEGSLFWTSLFLFALTLDLKANPMVPIGPGFYPRIVLGITALFAALLVITDWRLRPAPRSPEKFNYGLVAAMFAAFGLYAGALPFLGFRIATFAYVAGANALLDPPRGARGWLRAATVGLIATVIGRSRRSSCSGWGGSRGGRTGSFRRSSSPAFRG